MSQAGEQEIGRDRKQGVGKQSSLTTVLPMHRGQSKLRVQKGTEARSWLWDHSLIREGIKII